MYCVGGNVLNWTRSYLSDREQYVALNGIKSNRMVIKWGVPQGSILLFTIYINDLVNISSVLNMILFADDTNLFLSGRNLI